MDRSRFRMSLQGFKEPGKLLAGDTLPKLQEQGMVFGPSGEGRTLIHGPARAFREIFDRRPCGSVTGFDPEWPKQTEHAEELAFGFMQVQTVQAAATQKRYVEEAEQFLEDRGRSYFLHYAEIEFEKREAKAKLPDGSVILEDVPDPFGATLLILCGGEGLSEFFKSVRARVRDMLPAWATNTLATTVMPLQTFGPGGQRVRGESQFETLVWDMGFQVVGLNHAVRLPPKGTSLIDWGRQHNILVDGNLLLIKRNWASETDVKEDETTPEDEATSATPLPLSVLENTPQRCREQFETRAEAHECRMTPLDTMRLAYYMTVMNPQNEEELEDMRNRAQARWTALRQKFESTPEDQRGALSCSSVATASLLSPVLAAQFDVEDVLAAATSGVTLRVWDKLSEKPLTLRIGVEGKHEMAVYKEMEKRDMRLVPVIAVKRGRVRKSETQVTQLLVVIMAPLTKTMQAHLECYPADGMVVLPVINTLMVRMHSAGLTHANFFLSNFFVEPNAEGAYTAYVLDYSSSSFAVFWPHLDHVQILDSLYAVGVKPTANLIKTLFRDVKLDEELKFVAEVPPKVRDLATQRMRAYHAALDQYDAAHM